MAAKETEKLSEELTKIEKDIQTKEQQFLVSIFEIFIFVIYNFVEY